MSAEPMAKAGVRHRRQAGLVVLGVALVLVVVLTGTRPHAVAGAGRAAPVPGPPAVGDCVLDPLPPPTLIFPTVTARSGGTVPVYPAQQIGPCTAARYGEVVSVIPHPAPTVVQGDDANGLRLEDPNAEDCFGAAYAYLGIKLGSVFDFWQTYLQFSTALSRPSLRQQAAGQRWAVCIVALRPPDPGPNPTTRTPVAPQYTSSIRNALHTGAQRDRLGICLPTGDWAAGFHSDGCRAPHTLELFGSGDSGDHPITRTQVLAACRQLARQLTAMPDPTAAGALAIGIDVADRNGTVIRAAQVPVHSLVQCGVISTSNRTLSGSLVALGRQPIPWTP